MITAMLRESLAATVTRKIGYVLSKAAYRDFRKRVDYSEYGGAPLLGVKGATIICHGRSNANAIKNAIRVAASPRAVLTKRLQPKSTLSHLRRYETARSSCVAGVATRLRLVCATARPGAMDARFERR